MLAAKPVAGRADAAEEAAPVDGVIRRAAEGLSMCHDVGVPRRIAADSGRINS